ncbi:uncharacterized protein J3R85_003555 [Psidium guajava]|nr:uncharacterized protein J3R85_003555 [Psidium guajava]
MAIPLRPLSLLEVCSTKDELTQIHASTYVQKRPCLRAHPCKQTCRFLQLTEFWRISNMHRSCLTRRRQSKYLHVECNDHLVRGYSRSTEPEQALLLYGEMTSNSVPHNAHALPFLLRACSKLPSSVGTMQIHARAVKMGFGSGCLCHQRPTPCIRCV